MTLLLLSLLTSSAPGQEVEPPEPEPEEEPQPEMLWTYSEPMDIRVCYGDQAAILRALTWLQSCGWEFGAVRVGGCDGIPQGEIWTLVLPPTDEWTGIAGRTFGDVEDGRLKSAIVAVKPWHLDNALVWAHEFGHAVGLPHYSEIHGTPMYPDVSGAGWGTTRMWRDDWR